MAVTLKDIAAATGFEISTVSKVLRGDQRCYASVETRRAIVEAAHRLDYVPNHFARSLQTRRSHSIGIIGNLGNYGVASPMFRAITADLHKSGYVTVFCESYRTADGERRALRELRGRHVDGVIIETGSDDADLERIISRDIPCVLIRYARTSDHPTVTINRTRAYANVVRWLSDLGHRRIAFVHTNDTHPSLQPTGSTARKMAGYRAALDEIGAFDEGLVFRASAELGAMRDMVRAQAERFRTVTAVLAANDRLAIEVMSGLAAIGRRVPEDCSVVGFDNTEFAEAVTPRLTSFDARRDEAGARAVRMTLDLIAGRAVESVDLTPRLVERDSTGPCRSA